MTIPITNQALKSNPLLEKENLLVYQKACTALEEWGSQYLLKIFQGKNLFSPGISYNIQQIRSQLEPLPFYFQLLDSLLEMLHRRKLINIASQNIYQLSPAQSHASPILLDNQKQLLIEKYPFLVPETSFLERVLKAYLSILTGRENFLNIMFPAGRFDHIEAIYKKNIDSIYYNKLLAKLVITLLLKLPSDTPLKILEIGAGIGATTEQVLPLIADRKELSIIYHYTDISKVFVNYGKKNYYDRYPFLVCDPLNIEITPTMQGFNLEEYDVIIASNVLHATKDILTTLHHIKLLIKSGGFLILNESTSKRDFSTLAFGLATGWWASKDAWRIPGSPFISAENWTTVLAITGFKNISSSINLLNSDINGYQDIIIAINEK